MHDDIKKEWYDKAHNALEKEWVIKHTN
jgi:hypothetical protein